MHRCFVFPYMYTHKKNRCEIENKKKTRREWSPFFMSSAPILRLGTNRVHFPLYKIWWHCVIELLWWEKKKVGDNASTTLTVGVLKIKSKIKRSYWNCRVHSFVPKCFHKTCFPHSLSPLLTSQHFVLEWITYKIGFREK